MDQFRELMQKYVNEDYNTLVGIAKGSLVEALPALEKVFPDQENGSAITVAIILLGAVGADGTLTVKERQFIKDLLGLDDAALDNIIKLYTGKEQEAVKALVNVVDNDTKINIINICACIVACDETITGDELSFVRGLLG